MAWHQYQTFASSNIQSVRYDSETRILEVTFLNGGVYQYFEVPEHVSRDFEQSPSKGEYLAAHIKGQFRYSKV
jgi:hypothetical protein